MPVFIPRARSSLSGATHRSSAGPIVEWQQLALENRLRTAQGPVFVLSSGAPVPFALKQSKVLYASRHFVKAQILQQQLWLRTLVEDTSPSEVGMAVLHGRQIRGALGVRSPTRMVCRTCHLTFIGGVRSLPHLDFTVARPIPPGHLNNEFGDWNGVAKIVWPEWNMSCGVASPGTTRYLLHTPGSNSNFFSFEPVSHSVDAFNRSYPTGAGGLVELDTEVAMRLEANFRPVQGAAIARRETHERRVTN